VFISFITMTPKEGTNNCLGYGEKVGPFNWPFLTEKKERRDHYIVQEMGPAGVTINPTFFRARWGRSLKFLTGKATMYYSAQHQRKPLLLERLRKGKPSRARNVVSPTSTVT